MLPAARIQDRHQCPLHDIGAVSTGEGTVATNGRAQAHAGACLACQGGPADFIVTGSETVFIRNRMAARLDSKTMHGGTIVFGSGNVFVGGPTKGASLGNVDAGVAACKAAAKGRSPAAPAGANADAARRGGSTQQSYGNCGIEASRILINQATGAGLSEEDLLNEFLDDSWFSASTDPKTRSTGASTDGERADLLSSHGVESSLEWQSMETITQAVAEGKGVITGHRTAGLWGTKHSGNHAITVTGLEYDADGRLASVTTLDTGLGECARGVDASQFEESLKILGMANVTRDPIW